MAEFGFAPMVEAATQVEEIKVLRALLRHRHGTTTRWWAEGLALTCEGEVRDTMVGIVNRRMQERGKCSQRGIVQQPIKALVVMTAHGVMETWKSYTQVVKVVAKTKLADIVEIHRDEDGVTYFRPVGLDMPMKSDLAHKFRDFCLVILANYPELIFRWAEEKELDVHHGLEDKHHIFNVQKGRRVQVSHHWASLQQEIEWQAGERKVEEVVAKVLAVPVKSVWVVPHHWLQRMQPIWAGRRRWTITRKKFKKLIRRRKEQEAFKGLQKTEQQWQQCNPSIGSALKRLHWKQVHKLEGVSAYQTQNLVKLKHGRLRLWTGKEMGFRCARVECQQLGVGKEGRDHIIWACADAQAFWQALRKYLGGRRNGKEGRGADHDEFMESMFSKKLAEVPTWLTQWGKEIGLKPWEELYAMANQVWGVMCATIVTTIWRWNVDRVHRDGRKRKRIEEGVAAMRGMVRESIERFNMGLYPVTSASLPKIQVVEFLVQRWRLQHDGVEVSNRSEVTRVGFFDGGSRGNPGPGGSGSVVIETDQEGSDMRVIWAAATALGSRRATNNVAEFIGLHRLLTRAVEQEWSGLQVVGDSAMILRMMETRKPPKSRKLLHWYVEARKLADLCRVRRWEHHYRSFNKMADWLANRAMDGKRSEMVNFAEYHEKHGMQEGLQARMDGDMQQWRKQRETEQATNGT